MPTDLSLRALREAAPRHQPDFDELLARSEALGARITSTPAPARRELAQRTRRRQVIGLSAAAAAALSAAGVIAGLTVSAASPPSAYAAAKKALTATRAAASGTMTVTAGPSTLYVTRWHGHNIAMTSGPLGPNKQLRLIAGGAYVQAANGNWRHYRDASKLGQLGHAVSLAHANVAGTAAEQIIRLATDLHKTVRRDGTTLYTGTIHTTSGYPAFPPTQDAIMNIITDLRSLSGRSPSGPLHSRAVIYHNSMHLRMTVGQNDLVKKITLSFRQHSTNPHVHTQLETSSVTYSHLGSTPRITAPATSTGA